MGPGFDQENRTEKENKALNCFFGGKTKRGERGEEE